MTSKRVLERSNMPLYRNKIFLTLGCFFVAAFLTLLSFRMDIWKRFEEVPTSPQISQNVPVERDNWMNIFQKGRKIGFSHSVLSHVEAGYRLQEDVFMRINTLGMIQDLSLKTRADLNRDLTLSHIEMRIESGRFQFYAAGQLKNDVLRLETRSGGTTKWYNIRMERKPLMLAGVLHAAHAAALKPGEEATYLIFDPTSMGQQSIRIRVLGRETIHVMGEDRPSQKISLEFKGSRQLAWIDQDGNVLREHGLLGISMERTTQAEALYGLPIESSEDLTQVAAVRPDRKIENPARIRLLRLRIDGIRDMDIQLDGGRQSYENNVLTIRKETVDGPPEKSALPPPESASKYLRSTPFIQSDDPAIQKAVAGIIDPADTPRQRAEKIQRWIFTNIDKKPVLSLPDALSTLENRVGDCNEHAVLFAAMARAAGIPTRVEAGLVYLRGRFYYHAWNLLYLGRWITADALFGQFPADATHLRLAGGDQAEQLDLMGAIGNIRIQVLEAK